MASHSDHVLRRRRLIRWDADSPLSGSAQSKLDLASIPGPPGAPTVAMAIVGYADKEVFECLSRERPELNS